MVAATATPLELQFGFSHRAKHRIFRKHNNPNHAESKDTSWEGGKKISKSNYVPRFIQTKQHYMKCQETFSRGPWIPVQNETFYSCYRATFAAANAANCCCISKLCRCNYRHYSKTNQMLEFHQNQSRNSLYLTAWNYLSDKIVRTNSTNMMQKFISVTRNLRM